MAALDYTWCEILTCDVGSALRAGGVTKKVDAAGASRPIFLEALIIVQQAAPPVHDALLLCDQRQTEFVECTAGNKTPTSGSCLGPSAVCRRWHLGRLDVMVSVHNVSWQWGAGRSVANQSKTPKEGSDREVSGYGFGGGYKLVHSVSVPTVAIATGQVCSVGGWMVNVPV